jgi:pimeloyl-ACP methyl ester carboxylesterase
MECKIKNVSINYEIIGSGRPIVMLHGYYVDYRVMAGCMEPLFKDKEGYKRVYIDLPGMGKSGSAGWIANSDDIIEVITEFIEKIIPDENFLLAGQSYGGYLARGVLYKMTGRVDGVLLICPVIIADNEKRNVPDHVVLVKDENLLSRLSAEEAEDFSSGSVVQSERIYERSKNEVMAGVELADSKFLQSIRKNGYGFSFDVDNLKEKFKGPSLLLLGKQDDCVGYKDCWSILDNFSRATFAVLDTAGHSLQIEQEEVFNSLVKEWLKRVDYTSVNL